MRRSVFEERRHHRRIVRLLKRGWSLVEVAKRVGISRAAVGFQRQKWERTTGEMLPRQHRTQYQVSAVVTEMAALCDGTRTMAEIADMLGIKRHTARWRMRRARKVFGDVVKYKPMGLPGRPPKDGHEPDDDGHPDPPRETGCTRCGLHGEHECMLGVDHYSSSGASNLGRAQASGSGTRW